MKAHEALRVHHRTGLVGSIHIQHNHASEKGVGPAGGGARERERREGREGVALVTRTIHYFGVQSMRGIGSK